MKTICCIIAAVSVLASHALSKEAPKPLPIRQKTLDQLRELMDSGQDLPPDTFLLVDNIGLDFPITKVPEPDKKETEQWFRRLVRPEWLPADIIGNMRARKDAVVRKLRDPATKEVIYWNVGDYLVMEYEINECHLTLQESGATVTALIQFPENVDVKSVNAPQILRLVSKFFNMPPSAVDPENIKMHDYSDLRRFRRINGPGYAEVLENARKGGIAEWWYWLVVYFDGQTLIMNMPEISDKPASGHFSPRIGLRDRF